MVKTRAQQDTAVPPCMARQLPLLHHVVRVYSSPVNSSAHAYGPT